MLIAAALCLCAAVAIGIAGLWQLAGPRAGEPARQVLRAVAPTQLAASVMLAAAGVVALSTRPETGVLVVLVCVVGAVATIAAGCWQSAKAAAKSAAARSAARQSAAAGCGAVCAPRGRGGACASCTLSCR
jgi:hypothetical protein